MAEQNNVGKVTFSQLSGPVKAAVIISYVIGSIYAIAFLFGFFIAMMA